MSSGIFRFVDFTISKRNCGTGFGRCIISNRKNADAAIGINCEIIENAPGEITARANFNEEDIENLKAQLVSLLDIIVNTPAETFQERFERNVNEETDKRLREMSWFQRLFIRIK